MNAMLKWIIGVWNLFWGSGGFQYLLLAAILYLLIKMRKERAMGLACFYTLCALAVFFFPPTAKIISKCTGLLVYWRVLWIIPTVPLIAAAAADLISRRKKGAGVLLAAVLAVVAAVSGEGMFSADNYVRTVTYQQVPDEVAAACNLIREDAGDGEVLVATDDYLASYVRVYDPSFYMPYGRGGRDAVNKNARYLYKRIQEGTNYEKIAKLAKKLDCNYLVVTVHDEEERGYLEAKGYCEIGTAKGYSVFALRE